MREANCLPRGERHVHALSALPNGPRAPGCLVQLFTRELANCGHLQANYQSVFASEKEGVLICVNIGNAAPADYN
jgi:hypothetical protein